jgi:hypothetical protein
MYCEFISRKGLKSQKSISKGKFFCYIQYLKNFSLFLFNEFYINSTNFNIYAKFFVNLKKNQKNQKSRKFVNFKNYKFSFLETENRNLFLGKYLYNLYFEKRKNENIFQKKKSLTKLFILKLKKEKFDESLINVIYLEKIILKLKNNKVNINCLS